MSGIGGNLEVPLGPGGAGNGDTGTVDAAVKVIVMRGECGADSPFWTEDGHFIRSTRFRYRGLSESQLNAGR